MIRQFVHLIHKRHLYATPLSDISIKQDIIKPHEIAEAEEKEHANEGNYWAKQVSSGEDYSEIEKRFIQNNQQIIKQNQFIKQNKK